MMTETVNRESQAEEGPRSTSWDGGSELSLHLALRRPASDCVEADLIDHGAWPRPRANHRLSLTVTTQSTYRQPIAKAFAAAINDRLGCSKDLHQRIHTALQEAIMNALIHGNLGLEPQFRGNLQGLTRSQAVIEELLDRPAVARSPIRVDAIWNATTLHVLVRDSGKGFAPNRPYAPEALRSELCHGRGLLLIEAFCDRVVLLNDGSTIKLAFRR
jgi:anti-sigma regulatory factor (Ser/Thr protein kinase)